MKLQSLIGALETISIVHKSTQALEQEIPLVTQDARKVIAGAVFVAIKGAQRDGHSFLLDAQKNGAIALIVEDSKMVPKDFEGTVIQVRSTRRALDRMAATLAGDPTDELLTFGVTGTNGKTSVTYMLEWILSQAHLPTGVLGTIDHHLGSQKWSTEMTTPEPVQLQNRIKEMKSAGARAIAMEVSSHALDQFRADSVHFDAVAFTNLTRDHLDYHSTMEAYFSAKERLFNQVLDQSKKTNILAAINGDDDWGKKIRASSKAQKKFYGQSKDCDVKFQLKGVTFAGTDFQIQEGNLQVDGHIPSIGLHNVYNCLAAVIMTQKAGVDMKTALGHMRLFAGVPGRLQKVPTTQARNVYVDYAHTPDALENVLKALNQVRAQAGSSGRIITVFGCGGDRDKGKRPLMAKIAKQFSDQVIVTSDNPRTENPDSIIDDIMVGFGGGSDPVTLREIDRKKAIQKAIEISKNEDVVLIAGKGHEDYQIIGDKKYPFHDLEIAKEFLT